VRGDQGEHQNAEAGQVDGTSGVEHRIPGRGHILSLVEGPPHDLPDDEQDPGRERQRSGVAGEEWSLGFGDAYTRGELTHLRHGYGL
jgi:hypothetical protein